MQLVDDSFSDFALIGFRFAFAVVVLFLCILFVNCSLGFLFDFIFDEDREVVGFDKRPSLPPEFFDSEINADRSVRKEGVLLINFEVIDG